MSSDNARHAADKAFKPVGIGMFGAFCCARCAKHKPTPGRKLQRVGGLRQWVCAGCAKQAAVAS